MRLLRSLAFLAVLPLMAMPAAAQNLTFAVPDVDYHIWFDDFDDYAATDWIITTTEDGGGDATEAVSDADGGILLITNDAGVDDADFFQWAGVDASAVVEAWTYEAANTLLFKTRLAINDADQTEFVAGLQVTDTSPLAVANGIFFQSDDEDANIDFHVCAASTCTDVTAVATLTDATYVELAFYHPAGDDLIHIYVDDALVGTAAVTNAPSTELAVSFGVQNGETANNTLSVDYIGVWKDR